MKNIEQMREKMFNLIDDLRKLQSDAEKEERTLTPEEAEKRDKMMADVRAMESEIATETEIQKIEARKAQQGAMADDEKMAHEWRGGIAEMMQAVLHDPNDKRLVEHRQQAMDVGVMGGFLVPTQFSDMVREITPQDSIVRPRATVIPAGSPPDSAISMPALDQSGARGVYSGVTVAWTAEGAAKPETDFRVREITLSPNEVSGYIPVTDKLLRNTAAASALVTTLLRRAILAAEDVAFISGNGAGQPLGIINHPATIQRARTGFPSAAPGDNYVDIVSMYSSVIKDGPLVWVYTPTLLGELMTMTDVNGNLIWTSSAREGEPNRLLGIPAIENERSPVQGQPGDLMLLNLNHYMIKDGSGIFIAASEHVRFLSNQTVIKAFWNVDGQPDLTTPLTLEDGVTQRSPFVQLT